jgi:Uma2 family endonuclease
MSTIMTTRPTESAIESAWVPGPPFRMSLEQYEAMVETGVFTERDRFHLINGVLVAKMTQNSPHATADLLCRDALMAIVPNGWHVRSDKPVRLPPDSKPEPDQCVARGSIRDYARRAPQGTDVSLIVEVADTSLDEDRMTALTYSASGIPVYWIINLGESQVEVYTDPSRPGYGARRDYKPGERIPVMLDGVEVGQIAVTDILP